MNRFNFYLLVYSLLLLTLFTLFGCKKYDQGPTLTLKSKRNRVANTWQVEKASLDGADKTNEYFNWRLTMTKEGTYLYYSVGSSSISLNFTGSWELSTNDKNILIFFKDGSGTSSTKVYKIVRLKDNELWVIDTSNNYEIHFVPA